VNSVSDSVKVSELLNGQSIVPVVVLDNKDQAVGLANALLEGGIRSIEITLRNSYGMQAIRDVKSAFPEMVTLAGTVTNSQAMLDVMEAGVDGVVSPGLTDSLLATAQKNNVPFLPGVGTSSEIIKAMEYGLTECKLFPATVVGGVAALKALGGPFGEIKFCPTGGIGENNYREFLALPNVMCVGGSWIAPSDLIESGDWKSISEMCRVSLAAL
jgi:2-dehydro-3-deoxyphosphogluconate aldolase/(4S)-4-hydroxy-2-oxoglutarate aldolase